MAVAERDQLVRALCAVDGVADAEIVDDPSGVGTLRLTLVPAADEVQVAMAVNRVLRDGFGLGVDAGRVQVVEETWPAPPPPAPERAGPEQAVPADQPGPAHARPSSDDAAPGSDPAPAVTARVVESPVAGGRGRLSIRRLQLVSAGVGVSTAVTLGLGEQDLTGSADAEADPSAVHRAVAVATLRALAAVLDSTATLTVDDVAITPIGTEHVVVVIVTLSTPQGIERLTGAAVVREDARQAVIRATLDAVNRRVEGLIRHG